MLQCVCEQHSLRGRAVVIHFVALGGQRVGVALSCKTDNMLGSRRTAGAPHIYLQTTGS